MKNLSYKSISDVIADSKRDPNIIAGVYTADISEAKEIITEIKFANTQLSAGVRVTDMVFNCSIECGDTLNDITTMFNMVCENDKIRVIVVKAPIGIKAIDDCYKLQPVVPSLDNIMYKNDFILTTGRIRSNNTIAVYIKNADRNKYPYKIASCYGKLEKPTDDDYELRDVITDYNSSNEDATKNEFLYTKIRIDENGNIFPVK